MTVEERVEQLRIECDNYNRALQALKALTHELLWDPSLTQCVPNSIASFGRRMHTSAANRIAPARKVTPDMVVQRGGAAGTIVELKASVPKTEEYRRAKLIEVQKYDDDLTGWARPLPRQHDLILLVEHTDSQTIKEDIEALIAAGHFTSSRPFALVYFSYTQRSDETWIALHLIHGNVSDAEKQTTLHRICLIHPENIAANPHFGSVLIYDARPPLPLLMLRLFEAINSNLSETESLKLRTEGQLSKTMTLAQMKGYLSDFCCPHQTDARVPQLPETAWIKSALRMWVSIDWAQPSQSQQNAFDIQLKTRRREPFKQFLKVCAEADVKKENQRQKELDRQRKLDERYKEKYPLFALAEEEAKHATSTDDGASASGEAPTND